MEGVDEVNAFSDLERYRYLGGKFFEEKLYVAAFEEANLWLSAAERLIIHEEQASALNALGCISLEIYEWDTAIKYFQRALKIASQPSTRAKLYKNLGLTYFRKDDLISAKKAYEESLKNSWAIKDVRFHAQLHMDFGGIMREVDLDEAIVHSAKALSLFQGAGDLTTEGRIRNNLGILYAQKGKYKEAEENLIFALELLHRTGDTKDLTYTFTEIARLYYEMKSLNKAKEYCKKALETIFSDVTVMNKSEVAKVRYLFGLIFEVEGHLAKAYEYVEKACQYFEEYRLIQDSKKAKKTLKRIQEKISMSPEYRYDNLSEEDRQLQYLDTFLCIGDSLEAKDKYTRNHSERVAGYAVRIAKHMDLPKDQRELLSKIGRVHDIGKIMIAEEILRKPTHLTDEEFAIVKLHPSMGEMILKNRFLVDEGLFLVRHHHERYDGKGYPDGITGDELPLLCSILSVADAYDAMTSHRPYRPALFHSSALKELEKCAGTQFNPDVVGVFKKCFLI